MPYKTLSELTTAFQALVTAHPSNASAESIGTSYLGKDIMAYHFGNPNGGHVMWTACIHGLEILNSEILLQYANWLFDNSIEANMILQYNWTTIIPVINVDNYRTQRKNAHIYTTELGTGSVDLNRNFQSGFAGSNAGTTLPCSAHAASQIPSCYNYQGPFALSEPESQSLHAFQRQLPIASWYVALHTGTTNLLYRPIQGTLTLLNAFMAEDLANYPSLRRYVLVSDPNPSGMDYDDIAILGNCKTILWETHPTERTYQDNNPPFEDIAAIWFPRFLQMAKLINADITTIAILNGFVRDSAGTPIQGATVKLRDAI